jgi:dihydrolipoamide dehydrogenase
MLADKVFLALGREPNLQHMGLEALGIVDKGKLTLSCDPHTMQIGNLPIYMAGDVRQERPLLHEAQDDGHIAGYNAVHTPSIHFKRRTLLTIVHTDPAIVKAGAAWENLPPKSFHTGETTFENQEGALLLGQQVGYVRIYAHKETAVILGAEMLAPLGEHLGHLLAWLIAQKVTVFQALCMTFYHPLIEESLKKALQELADKFPGEVGKYPIDLQEYAA